MIKSIKIESYLLLKSQYIEFKEGLNVITGESGAGKSMLMDAIKFCLGLLASSSDNASVEIEINEDIVRRETKAGKSKFYINGITSNQRTVLETFGQSVMFQAQSSQSKIFKKHHQLEILDKDKDIQRKKKEFVEYFDALKQKEELLKDLLFQKESLEKEIEKNKELIESLEALNLEKDTYNDIKLKAEELQHAEKINTYIQNVLNALEYSDHSAISKINYSISQINQALSYKEDLQKAIDKLNALKDQLLETVSFIASYKVYVDVELIDKLNETIFNVQSLERKYKMPFEKMFEVKKSYKENISSLKALKENIEHLFREIEYLKKDTLEKANELSNLRKAKAKEISTLVNNVLKLLNLKEAYFDIDIKPKELSRNGIDDITFLFSSYSKEHMKELAEVASWGETSRIVLAISSVLGDYETYVYDEIDAGTSGEASISIAKLLKDISKNAQIICISHTPALAAASSNHILVKRQSNDIQIKSLTKEERIEELSRLMGIVNEDTKKGAKKLIEQFS
ncbi:MULTISPECIES: AAA family ATPase [unclassified Hydrogenobaculum]|jgi:ATPase involved in DNA repair|uniref:AAA family ATPase n=1 Tax=unclassified Hydrogenobaculum TaxID=2622382 RepID=UPI0001C50A8D|nr:MULTISPECIES: AAA family ATPase [unclassified Hydrogenobaculum]AEF19166.1 SMC domain protein [Hydrogenobaculum sp. 3684]AEG46455.1 SMC domain protein [Hydrogenobaculum sp. SHO]AGG15099.1 DNA replication and repair protein RecN [Hydrogenobaculum sp. HO]AGH93395.1 ATPase involved in DNA repair [Hydrogenobaculum sp. SN]